MTKSEINKDFDKIKRIFFEKISEFNSDNCIVSISAKGNLIATHVRGTLRNTYRIHPMGTDSYAFQRISTESRQGIKNFDVDYDEILKGKTNRILSVAYTVYSEYWPFIKEFPELVSASCIGGRYCFNLKLGKEGYSYIFTVEEAFDKFNDDPDSWIKMLEEKIKEHTSKLLPCNIREKLDELNLLEDSHKYIYGSKLEKLEEFIDQYNKNKFLKMIIGNNHYVNYESFKRSISSDSVKYSYNIDKEMFIAKTDLLTYYINTESYKIEEIKEIEENKRSIRKQKDALNKLVKPLPYFEFVLSYFDKIKEMNVNIISAQSESTNRQVINSTNKSKHLNGICYDNTVLFFSYLSQPFSLKLSIPHLGSINDNIPEMREKAEIVLKEFLEKIKGKVGRIRESEIEKCKKEKNIYQSPSAKIIYDFLSKEKNPYSISRLCDYLVNGEEGYNPVCDKDKVYSGILKRYKKGQIENTVNRMAKIGLLSKANINGTSYNTDVYKANLKNKALYDLYFNVTGRDTEYILEDLSKGNSITTKDALSIVKCLQTENISDEMIIHVFNILKNHEFVLIYADEIKEAFKTLSDDIKMYIPFIIDEYREDGIERELLEAIIKE